MGWKEFTASVIEDVLTYLAAITGHFLSWPVMVLTVVLLLLKPIKRLISRLKVAKGWGSEVEFEIESLTAATDAAVADVAEAIGGPATDSEGPANEDPAPADHPAEQPAPEALEARARAKVRNRALVTALTQYAMLGENRHGVTRNSSELKNDAVLRKNPRLAVMTSWARVSAKLAELHAHFFSGTPEGSTDRAVLDDLVRSPHVPVSFVGAVGALLDLRRQVLQEDFEADAQFARAYVASAEQLESVADQLLTIDPDMYSSDTL